MNQHAVFLEQVVALYRRQFIHIMFIETEEKQF
jgi:hypothetical protein